MRKVLGVLFLVLLFALSAGAQTQKAKNKAASLMKKLPEKTNVIVFSDNEAIKIEAKAELPSVELVFERKPSIVRTVGYSVSFRDAMTEPLAMEQFKASAIPDLRKSK